MPDAHHASAAATFQGVVAIDGPSGAGKSTVARQLALRLQARYLDTGAMYRGVTWAVLRQGVAPDDGPAVAQVAEQCRLTVSTDAHAPAISVDDVALGAEIRGPAVTAAVSAVSAVPEVRRLLVGLQRELIGSGGIVVEGRDIGTVVAPQASLKVFLTASAGIRAGRRGAELGATAPDQLAATQADLSRRDELDSSRALDPLTPATDAVVLDTGALGVAQVVARVLEMVHRAGAGHPVTGG